MWLYIDMPGAVGAGLGVERGGVFIALPELNSRSSKLGSVLQRVFFWSNGRVTLYDQRNFSGRRLDLTGDCPHLQEKNFPERCNSVHVESGAWVGYEEQNYRGRQHLWDMYESGDYPSADRWCSSSDQIASVRSLKQDQSVPRIHLFEWPGYSGRRCEIQEDVPNMMSRFRVNNISSARVLGGTWVAYQEPNYRGAHFILERGDHNNCNEWGNHSGIIGSIRRVQFM
ncbi:gamma-crystallin C-like [Pleurodeles waltl]|uniref:gamma-crystallin C-like n=1 Tax=Pleurodeles waltl TaxID=8319 RepID=UPI0037094F18